MKFIFISWLLIIISCSDKSNSELKAWNTEDSWYNPPSHSDWSQLDSVSIINIDSVKFKHAETLLAEKTFIHLTQGQMQTLVSEKLNDMENLYLIRTVYLGNDQSGYIFYHNSDSLLIVHSSLGKNPKEMKHNVKIIRLPFQPKVVYNNCLMDQ